MTEEAAAARLRDPAASRLVVVEERPFNAETPLAVFTSPLTPTPLFYVRNHFDVPASDPAAWRLTVDGAVDAPVELALDEIRRLADEAERVVTLECAGNGRTLMTPTPPGTPWRFGAVGTARFRGVPLGALLDRCAPSPDAVEVAFEGADRGEVQPGRMEAFVRSLPVREAYEADALLAWEMNGQPLTAEHGSPLRLVVPRWYGVASVKWLVRVSLLTRPLRAFYQTERYIYEGEPGTPEGTPVTRMRVRSVIATPAEGEELRVATAAGGEIEIAGSAWSGEGAIERVDVSVDGGSTWRAAELAPAPSRFAARPWGYRWRPARPGAFTLASRATDAAGNSQPLEPVWNVHGYGNNGVQRVTVQVL